MEESEEGVRVKVRIGMGDGFTTQSRNVYMPTNESRLNADFMVPSAVFQVITFLAIADYTDMLPVTFEYMNGANDNDNNANLANVMH